MTGGGFLTTHYNKTFKGVIFSSGKFTMIPTMLPFLRI